MSTEKLIWKRGIANNLKSVPIESGSIICTTDTGELYMDIGTSRKNLNNVRVIDSFPTDTAVISEDKLYFLTTNNTFYRWINSKWVQITYVVDSALSDTSTNPVQNKAIYTEMSNITNSLNTMEEEISNLTTIVNSLIDAEEVAF